MIHANRYLSCSFSSRKVRLLMVSPTEPENGEEGPIPLPESERGQLLPTTEVDEVLCLGAPSTISDRASVLAVTPMVVKKARWAEDQGYDAVVVNCMVDPGVREAQREVSIPVIGAGRAAKAIASVLGDQTASIYPRSIAVNHLADDENLTCSRLHESAVRKIHAHGADSITMGCSYLGGAARRLQDELGVPVVGTVDAALRIAETIAILGILPVRGDLTNAMAAGHRGKQGGLLRSFLRRLRRFGRRILKRRG